MWRELLAQEKEMWLLIEAYFQSGAAQEEKEYIEMAIATKNIYGMDVKKLLAMLKSEKSVYPVWLMDGEETVLLVQTAYLLLRTLVTEEFLKRFPVSHEPAIIKRARDCWQKFEAEQAQARVYPTNVLMESESGNMARKLITGDDKVVWVDQRYLSLFGADGCDLAEFLLESIPYYGAGIGESPVRVSIKQGYTSGCVMPMVNLKERVWR